MRILPLESYIARKSQYANKVLLKFTCLSTSNVNQMNRWNVHVHSLIEMLRKARQHKNWERLVPLNISSTENLHVSQYIYDYDVHVHVPIWLTALSLSGDVTTCLRRSSMRWHILSNSTWTTTWRTCAHTQEEQMNKMWLEFWSEAKFTSYTFFCLNHVNAVQAG